jgi:peptidyl-prolyl cis-trans isomerase C
MKIFLAIFTLFSMFCAGAMLAAEADVPGKAVDTKTPAALETNKTESPEALAGETRDPNAVAVVVNGATITEGEVQKVIQQALARLQGQAAPQLLEMYRQQIRKDVLERLVTERLLEEQIKKKNITVSDEEVDEKVRQLAAQQNLTVDDLKALLEAYGKNIDDLRKQTRLGTAYEKLINSESAGKINVTQEEAKKYYEENTNDYKVPEQLRASHILISTRPTDPNSDPSKVKAEARKKAESLLKQIKNGADFAKLARTHSDCPSAKVGGDLDYFTKGKMVPEFEKAAFALDVGQVSGIVETSFGYHIIKATDRKKATTMSFDEAKADIIKTLERKKYEKFVNDYIESLRAKATIVYSSVSNAFKNENPTPTEPDQASKPIEKPAADKK